MLCGATAIHFDQLVFALFENTFSYITNPSKLIAPLISVTRLKLNKSVEQFHRGYILYQASAEVNSFYREKMLLPKKKDRSRPCNLLEI